MTHMYFDLSPSGEESFNKFLSLDPDLDHRRRGPSHGDNTSCVQNKSIGAIVFELRVQTDRLKCITLAPGVVNII